MQARKKVGTFFSAKIRRKPAKRPSAVVAERGAKAKGFLRRKEQGYDNSGTAFGRGRNPFLFFTKGKKNAASRLSPQKRGEENTMQSPISREKKKGGRMGTKAQKKK